MEQAFERRPWLLPLSLAILTLIFLRPVIIPPETMRAQTLLLYSPAFGLVREEQISDYRASLGDRLAVATVPGGHNLYWDAFDQTAKAVDDFLR